MLSSSEFREKWRLRIAKLEAVNHGTLKEVAWLDYADFYQSEDAGKYEKKGSLHHPALFTDIVCWLDHRLSGEEHFAHFSRPLASRWRGLRGSRTV
jgi:hypothetical protein